MSYLVYINGQLLDNPDKLAFSQTKQVNDIANLTTRNSNYTSNIKFPRTANNMRIFENTFNVGNQSNIPYGKADCNIIDADNGLHFIYNGWAILLESTETYYNVSIYDGIIDFYKAIENLSITDCDVSELNHVKNIESIINSWNTELPYRYNLADYNGNNLTPEALPSIDFQVPSASVPFIWRRIFEHIGWEFEGSIFEHEKFLNFWLTYPKPVSLETPLTNDVTEQQSQLITEQQIFPTGNGIFYGSLTSVSFLPQVSEINEDYYDFINGIIIPGLYRFRFSGGNFSLSNSNPETPVKLRIIIRDSLNQIVSTNDINYTSNMTIDLILNVGNKITIGLLSTHDLPYVGYVRPEGEKILTGSIETKIVQISGYTLGFDQAFIDYKVTDFIKEILIRFGLTPFKDKHSNKVRFLTLYELFQNTAIDDWSKNFISKISEKYIVGNYAQRSYFKYKYNDEEMKHNNGYISVNNTNLSEEDTILQSNIYSPDRLKSVFINSNIYRIWEKEIKEDGTINYKDLDGRFYFMRSERINSSITIGSTILGGSESNAFYYRENYYRLSFQNILNDFYLPIGAMLDKAKIIVCSILLNEREYIDLAFDRLKYVDKLASYYLVNKISNYTKGKPVNAELIEIDYFTKANIINPETPIDNTIEIGIPTILGCTMTLPITTDYPQPVQVQIIPYKMVSGVLGQLYWEEMNIVPPIITTLSNDELNFNLSQFPYDFFGYKFGVRISINEFESIISNITDPIILDGSCFIEPDYPDTISINRIIFNGSVPNPLGPFLPDLKNYTIEYSYTGIPANTNYLLEIYGYSTLGSSWSLVSSYLKISGQNDSNQSFQSGAIYNKIKLKINNVQSNEFDL